MSLEYRFNPITGKYDLIGQSTSDVTSNDTRYLKLDQTTAQNVDSGVPIFKQGLKITAGQKLIFDA